MKSRLVSGRFFDFDTLDCSALTIEEIAHALGNICRFGGHTPRFYSVAEHSVYVSEIVVAPAKHQRAALLHDACEALIGDMIRPIKATAYDFLALEARVEAAIFARFGVPYPLASAVIEADDRALCHELDAFENPATAIYKPRYLQPVDAADLFMTAYRELTP